MMKKLALIFPPPSETYKHVVWSVKDTPSPPQTAPTELGMYIKKYASCPVEVICINPQIIEHGRVRYRTVDEITTLCANSDIVGITCLYHNQETAHNIAQAIKNQDSQTTVVLGGQNISNKFMASLVLNYVPSVDFVVLGDGEDALRGLVEGKPMDQIPNVAYRKNGTPYYTQKMVFDINKIPLWDYGDTLDANSILEAYDSRTSYYQDLVRRYNGRTLGEIGVFSQRGCPKASGEVSSFKGKCRYCTSSESSRSIMNPDNFWKQIRFLYTTYGLQDFFIADNIFGTSLGQLTPFKESRQRFDISDTIQFRAYTYPSIINGPTGSEIAKQLRSLGITNIFLGVETFDPVISRLANKDAVTYGQAANAIRVLGDEGIDTFVAIMLGLQGESQQSLEINFNCLTQLLQQFSSKRYGEGKLTRIDISPAMPLVGTSWHMQLVKDRDVSTAYFNQTGRVLRTDMTPDFSLLRSLNLGYHSNIKEEDIQRFASEARNLCVDFMKPEMVGGFDLNKDNVKS